MSDAKPKYWMGDDPIKCDLSDAMPGRHGDMTVFVDGRMAGGSWANMCSICHAKYGVGLGTGRGQQYMKQENGRWLKTAG